MKPIKNLYKNSLNATHKWSNTAFLRTNRHKKIFSIYSMIPGIILIIFSFSTVFAKPLLIPFETLTVGTQSCDGTLTNAANSLGVNDGNTADCAGINSVGSGLTVTNFIPDPTNVTTAPILQVTINVHYYLTGWVDDSYDIELSNDNGGNWTRLERTNAPLTALGTRTYNITADYGDMLDTIVRINAAQVRIVMGSRRGGGPGNEDLVAIHLDAVDVFVQGTAAANNPPDAPIITSPTSGTTYTQGASITFTGTAIDPEDGSVTASLDWYSDIQGGGGATIGTGNTFNTSALDVGVHTITITATDGDGATSNTVITVTINAPPNAPVITSPTSGTTYTQGASITFTGTATDPEDGSVTASLDWYSDNQAGGSTIGTGNTFNISTLELGLHTITITATDGDGATSNTVITVTINAPPNAPVITSPSDGSNYDQGVSVTFTGTATDPEDGSVTASLDWYSNIQGGGGATIGTGNTFNTSALDVGVHTITITATDGDGATNNTVMTVTINAVANTPPDTLNITSPADGSTFNQGASVSFAGNASDPEDGDITASMDWVSDIEGGSIGTGGAFSTSTLSPGVHTITITATDSLSATISTSITVTINAPPDTLNITSPADGSTFVPGASVTFTGNASDPEDLDITASMDWDSDLDGNIGTGGSFSTSTLSAGTHTITITATDVGGLTISTSITVTINQPPDTLNVTSPADGSNFDQGTSVSFAGNASDPEDGNISATIDWDSNLDGNLGTGGSFSTNTMSVGVHTITVTAIDTDGGTLSTSITVTIDAVAGNNAPVVTITNPADLSSFNEGANINFTGTATDTEDNDVTLTTNLSWSSSLDGVIGATGSVNTATLSPGVHTITASVTDSGGIYDSDSITVTIIANDAPTISITSPSHDMMYDPTPSTITFTGVANDAEDGAISGTITWTSNLDGSLGPASASFSTDLTIGTHIITASVTDLGGKTATDFVLIYVGVNPPTPHGPYAAATDQCARCHRSHSAENESLLVYTTVPNVNAFCMVCHDGTGAPVVQTLSTHSNADYGAAQETPPTFTLLCTQCHEPHGSNNLVNIRPNPIVVISPWTTVGPVNFTSLTGVNSFDEDDSGVDGDDLCAVCHLVANNPGGMTSHDGGEHTNGWGNQTGKDCTLCHSHSRDADPATNDGFMPQGCTECHNSAQDDGDGFPAGGRVAIVGDFSSGSLSHHITPDDAVTDAQCMVCHDMDNHAGNSVVLKDPDSAIVFYTESAPGEFRTANISGTVPGTDLANMTLFCGNCHDTDGATRLGAPANPFGDGTAPPEATVHSNVDFGSAQEPATFTVDCVQCHASHGTSNLSIVNSSVIAVPATTFRAGIVYTATTGAGSLSDADSANDLCATCHLLGTMTSHDGGAGHSGGSADYQGDDCTSCHTHDFDNDLATLDGFMPSGGSCTGCHELATDNFDGVPVNGISGRRAMMTELQTASVEPTSHHIAGVATDAQCEFCHDQTTHMDGFVDLVDQTDGTPIRETVSGGFRTDFISGANLTAMTTFCKSCHDVDGADNLTGSELDPFGDGTPPPVATEHGNDYAGWVEGGGQGAFTIDCVQCHASHGSTNLSIIETSIIFNPGSAPQTGVVYTALTGAGSLSNTDSANDLCATCHIPANNPPTGLTNHDGGDGHAGGDYAGDDCRLCHTHELDNVLSTLDGFMPSGGSCTGCHNQGQGARRQVVDSNSDSTGTGGDFLRSGSHHMNSEFLAVPPNPPLIDSIPDDADCEVCHDQSAHQAGEVKVFNADTGASYNLENGTAAQIGANYVLFCTSCHDGDGATTQAGGVPFTDNIGSVDILDIPVIDSAVWQASSHAENPVGPVARYYCNDCHSNGHGSNKVAILSSPTYGTGYAFTGDGGDTNGDDSMQEEERFCYQCHDGGVASTDIQAQFALAVNWVSANTGQNKLQTLNDRHDVQDSVQSTSGSVIECTDCHDVHGDNASWKVVFDPDGDGTAPVAGTLSDTLNSSNLMSGWCLDCHDNSYPASISVTDPLVNILTTTTDGHSSATGGGTSIEAGQGYAVGMFVNCEYCHSIYSHVTPSANGTGLTNLFNLNANTYALSSYVMQLGSPLPDEPDSDGGASFDYGWTDYISLAGNNDMVDPTLDNTGYNWCQTCHTTSMGEAKDNCASCHYHGAAAKW